MRDYELPGLRVRLGQPRQALEGVGFLWFPSLDRFPSGELLLNAILVADTHENLSFAYTATTSKDDGRTWSWPFDVAGFGGGCWTRTTTPDGAVAGPGFYTWPDPPGQGRTFVAHYERYEAAGSRYVLEPYAVRIEGFPRPVGHANHPPGWGRLWPAQLVFFGHPVDLGGELVACTHVKYEGEEKYTEVCLVSTDWGRSWRWRADVAHASQVPDGREGPNESATIQLADGDLMCVMRVGSRAGQYLARSYSADGGRTWSAPDRLPAWSVAPTLRRLTNGVIALATGRPGLFLWLSDDPRGRTWSRIDLLAHHNALLGARHVIRDGTTGHRDPDTPDMTTAYTELVEIAPGRLLLVYDRVPFGWRGVPTESEERNRIYVVEIALERV